MLKDAKKIPADDAGEAAADSSAAEAAASQPAASESSETAELDELLGGDV